MLRKIIRGFALLAFCASSLMLASAWTAAEASATLTAKPGVLQASWFWQTAYQQTAPPVAEAPPATEPSGVPAGDLAVAYTGDSGGASSKLATLAFDLTPFGSGATVQSFTFSVTEDSSPTAGNIATSAAAIVACLPTRAWPAQMGGDIANAPALDCSHPVKPTVNGFTYTFTVTPYAQQWLADENLGVAIVNDPANSTPYQLVLSGPKTVKASMTYTPEQAATPVGSGTTSSATGNAATSAAPPSTSTGASAPQAAAAQPPSLSLPPATTTSTAPHATAPLVATSSAGRPVTAALKSAPAMPSTAFWAAAAFLALLVFVSSFALGNHAVPVAAGSRSRLERVLRDRDQSRRMQ